jgi:hypothetical protein
VRPLEGAPNFRGPSCELPVGAFESSVQRGRPRVHAAPRFSVSSWTASVRAHGPRLNARSTRRASPRLSCVRLKVGAFVGVDDRRLLLILQPLWAMARKCFAAAMFRVGDR